MPEQKISATELLLAEHRVSKKIRGEAARMVRLMGEAHLGSFYDGPDSAIVEDTRELETLKKNVE
jgi:hypothetical protein